MKKREKKFLYKYYYGIERSKESFGYEREFNFKKRNG